MNDLAPRDYHAVIAKAAAVKDVDVGKLKELMDLQEAWEKRRSDEHYNDNMALAQGEMTQISKDSVNPQTRSQYASLAALDAAIRPIYSKYGFSISFDEESASDTHSLVMAYVSCGATTRRFRKWVPVTTQGFRGQQMMTPTHASIGAVTYARRTLLKMIFNLAEEDDDGNLGKLPPDKSEFVKEYAPPTKVKRDDPPTDAHGNRI